MPFNEIPRPDEPNNPGGSWPGSGGAAGGGAAVAVDPSLSTGDLVSVDRCSMVFAMTEGPCGGAWDGNEYKSILLNGVPLMAPNGILNYEGVNVKVTKGTADQLYIPTFPEIESEYTHGGEVKLGTPLFFNVNSINANTARVKISVPQFQKMDAKTGKPGPINAQVKISVSTNGGAYVVQTLDASGWISGVSTGPYVKSYKIPLPAGSSHSVKVERLDAINTDPLVANKTYLQGWTEITDVKLRHPYVSLLAISFDAKLFGSIPTVTADWKGILLRVPKNYTPPIETAPGVWTPAVYATSGPGTTGGVWDGTFGPDIWCASPVWAFLTIATNRRYGCGKYLSDAEIDIDALYEISKYCDELVSDGMGGHRPRFACNAYLTNDEESFKVLAHIISCARAQLYYSGGMMRPVQDVDGPVEMLFSPSNVKEGRFSYQGVAKRARHTMAKVSWWDPAQSYKLVPEPIQHLEGIAKYGVQTLETTAFGSTNLAQTRAWGNWALITEQTETEAVTFTSGLEGMGCTVGNIIHIKNPARDGEGMGGRLLGATLTSITTDRSVTLQAGQTYTAWVTLNDGTVCERTVTTGAGTVTTIAFTPALPSIPQAENQWQISNAAASPARFRILSIKRPNNHEFEISALANNPAKYALADAIGSLVPTIKTPVVFSPVSGLTVTTASVFAQGQAVITVNAKWTSPLKATGFAAQAQVNGVWSDMAVVGSGASIQVPNAGDYPVRVAAVYPAGRSAIVTSSVTATDVFSDGVISRGTEKVSVQARWATAQADYTALGAKATALSVSRTAFDAAYAALNTIATRWADATVDTVVSDLAPTAYTRWGTWDQEKTAIQTAITAAAQSSADSALTRLTGLTGQALNSDPNLTSAALWTLGGATIQTVTDGQAGAKVLRATTPSNVFDAVAVPVDASRTYRVRALARNTAGSPTLYTVVDLRDSAGTIITGDGSYWHYPATHATPGSGWTAYAGVFGANTGHLIPANARTMRLGILMHYDGTGTQEAQALYLEDVTESYNAQLAADAAIARLDNIAIDGKVTAEERSEWKAGYESYSQRYSGCRADALTYGVSVSTLETCWSNYSSIVQPITVATGTSTVDFDLYRTRRGLLDRAIEDTRAAINAYLSTRSATLANAAQAAAIAAAAADATAKRVLAEAYADGVVDAEESARIDQANANLASAQAYADLKKTEAAAYADGIVDAEEARAIADALAKYNAAKALADAAQSTANTAVTNAATAANAAAYADVLSRSPHNLIKNGNSEAASPTGYEAAGITSATAYAGSKCRALVGGSSTTELPITGRIPVGANEQYYFECMLKLSGYNTLGGCLVIRYQDAAGASITADTSPFVTSASWVKNEVTVTTPANAATLTVGLYTSGIYSTVAYFDNIYGCRKISAGMLEADLALIGVIRSPNWIAGSYGNAPTGFKHSGYAFTTTFIDGTTDTNCYMELGGTANFGGHKVAVVNSRTMTAYNRILNGTFYQDLTGWVTAASPMTPMVYDAMSSTSAGGSASMAPELTGSPRTGRISQAFNCPPTTAAVNLTLSTRLEAGAYTASGNVKAYLYNSTTGVETLLATWTYAAKDNAWTARSVSLTSYVSGGGDFVLVLVAVATTDNVGTKMLIDNVKIII